METTKAFKIACLQADIRSLKSVASQIKEVKIFIRCQDHTIIGLEQLNTPIDLENEIQILMQKHIDFLTQKIENEQGHD